MSYPNSVIQANKLREAYIAEDLSAAYVRKLTWTFVIIALLTIVIATVIFYDRNIIDFTSLLPVIIILSLLLLLLGFSFLVFVLILKEGKRGKAILRFNKEHPDEAKILREHVELKNI